MAVNDITSMLKYEEGFRAKPYYCSEGYPTVGFGLKIGNKNAPLPNRRMTLAQADRELDNSIYMTQRQVASAGVLTDNTLVNTVLISMAYQMGTSGLLKFKKMLAAIADCDWDLAYKEGMDSRWAHQTPARAWRQMQCIKRQDFSSYDE